MSRPSPIVQRCTALGTVLALSSLVLPLQIWSSQSLWPESPRSLLTLMTWQGEGDRFGQASWPDQVALFRPWLMVVLIVLVRWARGAWRAPTPRRRSGRILALVLCLGILLWGLLNDALLQSAPYAMHLWLPPLLVWWIYAARRAPAPRRWAGQGLILALCLGLCLWTEPPGMLLWDGMDSAGRPTGGMLRTVPGPGTLVATMGALALSLAAGMRRRELAALSARAADGPPR